jgi:hypothetical protein
VIEFAKKHAVTEARKNVFQKIAIVSLSNGKIAIHLMDNKDVPQNDTSVDLSSQPMHYL